MKQSQVRLVFNALANCLPVQHPVSLSTSGTHCRAFSGVEDAELNTSSINRLCHRPAQSVYFPDDMTLADPANGRVTGHLSDGLYAVGDQQRSGARPRGGERRFGARVTAADHDNIKLIWIFHRSGA